MSQNDESVKGALRQVWREIGTQAFVSKALSGDVADVKLACRVIQEDLYGHPPHPLANNEARATVEDAIINNIKEIGIARVHGLIAGGFIPSTAGYAAIDKFVAESVRAPLWLDIAKSVLRL